MVLFIPFLLGCIFAGLFPFFPYSSSAVFLLSCAALLLKRRRIPAVVMVIAVAYAFVVAIPVTGTSGLGGRVVRVTGMFLPQAKGAKQTVASTFLVDEASDELTGEEIDGLEEKRISVYHDTEVNAEERYELLLEMKEPKESLNPGSPRRSWNAGVMLSETEVHGQTGGIRGIFQKKRNALNEFFLNRFSPDAAAFLAAITTGETRYVSEDLRRAFSSSGLAHILSISGSHFGLLFLVIFGIAVRFVTRLPYPALQRVTIYASPKQTAAIIALPVLLAYLGLSGMSLPAVRSFLMILLFLVGLLVGRERAWLNGLLFAAFMIVLWQPAVIFDLSFQLSFIAVLFIGCAVERRDSDEKQQKAIVRTVRNLVLVTAAATAGTAPLVAYHFHMVSLISPLANVIAAPLIGVLLIPLALFSSFVYLASGAFPFAAVVSAIAEASLTAVRAAADVPYADLPVPMFPLLWVLAWYAAFLPFLVIRQPRMLLLPVVVLALFVIAGSLQTNKLAVTFVDVGQGDSAVVELPDGRVLVVDTGRTGHETAQVLRALGRRRIDALVLSHDHPDHSGGRDLLLSRFRVGEIWQTGFAEQGVSPVAVRLLERGDLLAGSGYRIAVLHPYPGFSLLDGDTYDEQNNTSLVLKIEGTNSSFLFAGDVQEEAEEDLAHLGTWVQSDVLKVPHHGSRTSANERFIIAVAPSLCIVSVGRDNPFGHPSQEMLERCAGSRIYRTDRDGAVRITDGPDLQVMTAEDRLLRPASSFSGELRNMQRIVLSW